MVFTSIREKKNSKKNAMAIPLSSFCIAAAIVENTPKLSGKLIDCNALFRQLIVLEAPTAGGGGDHQDGETKSNGGGGGGGGGDTSPSTPPPRRHPLALEKQNIWKLLGISPPKATTSSSSSSHHHDSFRSQDSSSVRSSSSRTSSSSIASSSVVLESPPPPPPQTKQIFQGPNEPNKWVRIHVRNYPPGKSSSSSSSSSSTHDYWLLQLEDVDVAERAKNQWTAILETSFDGFWDYHIPKDYEYMSPRFWEMFGYQANEKQHKPSEWMDMVHPEDFKASMIDLQQHFGSKGEVPYIRETRYKHKDGSWVWVLCRGKVIEWDDDTGAPLRMIGTHTDITESKLKALRERELYDKIEREQKRIIAAKEELRKFVQYANAPVFGTDADGVIDTWNDRMEQITKISRESVLGKPLQGSPVEAAQTMVQRALEGNESTNEMLQVRLGVKTKDAGSDNESSSSSSSALKLLINTTTRRNLTDGGVLGCVCFGLDLTEIQLAQEKILRAEESFKAEKQLNEFVAHEVRNPLAAAISASGFIKDAIMKETRSLLPDDMQESMEEDVSVVVDSLDYIHQLLTSMLDFNKFLEKGVKLTPRNAYLRRDVIDPVFQLYKHRASKVKLTNEVWWRNVEDGLLRVASDTDKTDDQRVSIDVVRLKQILINLISNSIKFTKEGFIRVRMGRFDAKSPDKLSLLVEDSGPGIPKDKRKLLFEKYVQLSTQIQGSGIGLALTRQLVHAMQGTISIDEHYESGIPGIPGTRFVVHIVAPLVAEEVKAKKQQMVPPASSTNRTIQPRSVVQDTKPQIVKEDTNVATVPRGTNGTSPAMTNGRSQLANVQNGKPQVVYEESKTERAPPSQQNHRIGNGNGNSYPHAFAEESKTTMPSSPTQKSKMNTVAMHSGEVVTLEQTIDELQNKRDTLNNSMRMNAGTDGLTTALSEFETANLRVLVVDDDKIIRKLLLRRLKNIDRSMIIETAESGEVAVEMITGPNAKQYDLVLMDHFMPLCGGELTGEETIRIIRPHVEGVIAGSSGNDMSREHAAAGADLFWLKPVPKDNVLLDDLREAFKMTRCSVSGRSLCN